MDGNLTLQPLCSRAAISTYTKHVRPALFLSIAVLGFAQEAKHRAGKEDPWPPAQGTVRSIYDLAPMRATKLSLKWLCDSSDVIIDGTVQRSLPPRVLSSHRLETDFLISVGRVRKGPATLRQILVSQPGGSIGEFHMISDQFSLMQQGESYLLFLTNDNRLNTPKSPGVSAYQITQCWWGLFRVIEEKIQLPKQEPDELRKYEGANAESVHSEVAAFLR